MLERRKPLDLLFPLKGNASSREGEASTSAPTTVERLRAGVTLARDAVKAVSLTAMEALKEGASFIGIVTDKNELADPFVHLDAPIWSEQPPAELHKLLLKAIHTRNVALLQQSRTSKTVVSSLNEVERGRVGVCACDVI